MKKLIITYFLIQSTFLLAQNVLPGGVSNSLYWMQSESLNQKTVWKDINNSNYIDPFSNSESGILNGYNVKLINADQSTYDFQLPETQSKNYTFISVYQVLDTLAESNIWQLLEGNKTNFVMSSLRVADLEKYTYKEIKKRHQRDAELFTYTQNKRDTLSNSSTLKIGTKNPNLELPIKNFKGLFPEFVFFDRTLSPKEKTQVESYLAIKYGISLNQDKPTDYLNSEGKIIWDAKKAGVFKNRIAAIGRDDLTGLIQSKSTNATYDTPLSMAYSEIDSVKNLDFIFWSDNGLKPEVKKNSDGQPDGLQRIWKIASEHFQPVNLIFPDFQLPAENSSDNIVWLAIDREGKGDYIHQPIDYYPLNKIENHYEISNVLFDKDQNHNDTFTLMLAPEVFVQVWIEEPNCTTQTKGKLFCKPQGGVAPYQLQLTDANQQILKTWTVNDASQITELTDFESGYYSISITDANGKYYQDRLYLPNQEQIQIPNLQDTYTLIEGEELVLNADEVLNNTQNDYYWILPDQSIHYQPEIHIQNKGIYTLFIKDANGCETRKEIEVQSQSNNNIVAINLFPNPSSGFYALKILLVRPATTQIQVYNATGQLLNTFDYPADTYLMHRSSIMQSGMYYLKVTSENDTQTLKLIIEN